MTTTGGQSGGSEPGPTFIHAPFSDDQVEQLARYQRSGRMHPFTCGGQHPGGHVILTATAAGWVCPESCGYTQDWAHAFMADKETLDRMLAPLPAPGPLECPGC